MNKLIAFFAGLLVLTSCNHDEFSYFDGVYTDSIRVTYWPYNKGCAFTFTFDDNTSKHAEIGRLITRYNFTGTFFVNAGLNNFQGLKPLYQELQKNGNEIGNHTSMHLNLPDAGAGIAEIQIRDGAKLIENELGVYPTAFCHPYNAASAQIDSLVLKYHLFSRIASPYNLVNRKVYDIGPDWPTLSMLEEVINLGKNYWIIIAGHGYGENDVKYDFLENICKELNNSSNVWVERLSVVGAYDYLRQELTVKSKVMNDSLFLELEHKNLTKYEKIEFLPITIAIPCASNKFRLRTNQEVLSSWFSDNIWYFTFDIKK